MRAVLFPIVLLAILILIDIYTFYGLKSRWNEYSKWFRKTVRIFFISLSTLTVISFLVLFILGKNMPFWQVNFFFGFVVINLIVKLIFALFLFVDDFRRLVLFIKKKMTKPEVNQHSDQDEISRSDFILKSGIIAAAVPAISLPAGMVIGPYNYRLHQPEVKLPNLPKSFEGLKIVQISDVHSGSFYNKEAVNKGIDLLLAQKPDVVFFTGDLVNDSADEMDNYIDVFSRIDAPMGVYSILGNHDYGDYKQWESEEAKEQNLEKLKEVHKKLGWRLLLDENVYLEKEDDKIALIGVENWGAGFHQIGRLDLAYEGCDAPVKLLLSHDPTHWDEQVKKEYKDIDITFSGHTHGAQMGIETGGFKWSPISLRYEKWAGLYQENNQYLYINRGYGFLGYPGRIGIWPEITVMTLKSGQV